MGAGPARPPPGKGTDLTDGEDSGGVWAFLEKTQPHHVRAAVVQAVAEVPGVFLDEEDVTRSVSTAPISPACARCSVWTVSTGGR